MGTTDRKASSDPTSSRSSSRASSQAGDDATWDRERGYHEPVVNYTMKTIHGNVRELPDGIHTAGFPSQSADRNDDVLKDEDEHDSQSIPKLRRPNRTQERRERN